MPALQPVAWTEGAFLTQQHFQYWDEWINTLQNQLIDATVSNAYGLVLCEFDHDAFRQRKCVIKKLVLRKTTGQWLIYDSLSMPALGLTLNEQASQMVYLTQPKNTLCSGLAGYDNVSEEAASQAQYNKLPDLYDPVRNQEVAVAIPRLRLTSIAGDERTQECWPIAKIHRVGGTDYALDTSFIPVSMSINASDVLKSRLTLVLQALSAKMIRLKRTHSLNGYRIVYDAYYKLRDMLEHNAVHPRKVYNLLSLTTVSLALLNEEIIEFEGYRHQNMAELVLGAIDRLTVELQKEVESLPSYELKINDQSMHYLHDIDPEHAQEYDWYLGVDFLGENPDSIKTFISQSKIGTVETLEQILASALPGIEITHTLRPPKQISIQEGYEYFRLEHDSLYWKNLKEELSLMMYLPSLKSGVKISLDVVKD